jgi:phage FluMu protein Com
MENVREVLQRLEREYSDEIACLSKELVDTRRALAAIIDIAFVEVAVAAAKVSSDARRAKLDINCPHCGATNFWTMKSRERQYKCKSCRKKFIFPIVGQGAWQRLRPGERYGRLVVLSKDGASSRKGRHGYYRCRCDCGNTTRVAGHSLRDGNTKSCGCLRSEISSMYALQERDAAGRFLPNS